MRRIRVERKTRPPREERSPLLPIDPRDPDVVRVKADRRARERL